MKNKIITISRQIGSGGKSAGKELASLLGVPFYDRAIVDLAAKESGMDAEFIESGEQMITSSMLFNVATMGYGGYFTDAGNTLTDKIYMAESKVIRAIAEKGPCVIVGRCADYILREYDCFNVFMYAQNPVRVQRIMEERGVTEKEAEKIIKISDKRRSRHYEHYTGRNWGKATNYHLCIDGGATGYKLAAEVIMKAAGLK